MDHDHCSYWECGEFGHFQHDCPHLNYNGPAQLATDITYIHQPTQTTSNVIYADGHVRKVPKILLDTGPAVSVARYKFLPEEYHQRLIESPGTVGANGMPLNVVGKAKIAVSLGSFRTEEEFTVIRQLERNYDTRFQCL